jgi:hypothetical protein
MEVEMVGVSFPGFSLIESSETDKHDIELGTLVEGYYVFEVLMKRAKIVRELGLPFFVSTVSFKSKKIWNHLDPENRTISLLALVGDQNVIAVCTKGPYAKVVRVIPFYSFLLGKSMPDIQTQIDLKIGAATYLEKNYVLNQVERDFLDAKDRRETLAEHLVKSQAAQTAPVVSTSKASPDKRQREERRRELLSRTELEGWTAAGEYRHGLPLFEDEWASCPHGTPVILIDMEGKMLEAFKVLKLDGKAPQKGFVMPVHPFKVEKPATSSASQASIPLPVEIIRVDYGSGEVAVYETFEQIRLARKMGLNGGSLVTSRDRRGKEGRYMIFEVHAKNVVTIGNLLPAS